eukprot:TRINITY_DN7258_c0_g1_i1.p1 TRINITY_DN7258_c0_g1~~TRINITY_DN7258_c0_g1_i1.p1  ORF type:complete len:232 (-),score=37.01 TRINITY_DN7258_c0_g1_i1:131-826(-)
MSSDSSPPSMKSISKRKRASETSEADESVDEEPAAPLPRYLRPVILPNIDIDAKSGQEHVRIEALSYATAERTTRIGESAQQVFSDRLRDSAVTSIDTLPTDEFLDMIHIHGMRLAATYNPPKYRVLKPSALLGIGIAAQQFVLHRLKPLFQDHVASRRPIDAPPLFDDDIDELEQDDKGEVEPENVDFDDQPATQLPDSSGTLILQVPKEIEGDTADNGPEKSPSGTPRS